MHQKTIVRITSAQLEQLSPGTVLTSIFGETYVVGQDIFSLDTRGGYLAYGFVEGASFPEGMTFAATVRFTLPPLIIQFKRD